MAETVFANDMMRQWISFVRSQQLIATGAPYSGIPSTARAIMDLVPERKTPPLSEKQQLQGENIARAVQNLSRHENRLGCAGWEP